MFFLKINKIIGSVIKRANRIWAYAFTRLMSKYVMPVPKIYKAFFSMPS